MSFGWSDGASAGIQLHQAGEVTYTPWHPTSAVISPSLLETEYEQDIQVGDAAHHLNPGIPNMMVWPPLKVR